MMEFDHLVRSRTATQKYDAGASVSENILEAIVAESIEAPSSFNLQHWRFLVITEDELKSSLAVTTLLSNRERVLKSPVSVVILGDIEAHRDLSDILDECVAADTLARSVADEWLAFATKLYSEVPALAREEAIRSCSLAAMTFMLSAASRGFSTCPIGFNAPELIKVLKLPARYVPAIWLTLGKAAGASHGRRPRRPVSDILFSNMIPDDPRCQ